MTVGLDSRGRVLFVVPHEEQPMMVHLDLSRREVSDLLANRSRVEMRVKGKENERCPERKRRR